MRVSYIIPKGSVFVYPKSHFLSTLNTSAFWHCECVILHYVSEVFFFPWAVEEYRKYCIIVSPLMHHLFCICSTARVYFALFQFFQSPTLLCMLSWNCGTAPTLHLWRLLKAFTWNQRGNLGCRKCDFPVLLTASLLHKLHMIAWLALSACKWVDGIHLPSSS